MTEHCEHEGWCRYQVMARNCNTNEDYSCVKSDCKGDTRSRPAPSPIRSMREDEDGHISWQQMNEKALAEHDATIAAKAREEVTIDDFCTCDLTRYIQESAMMADDVSR